MFIRLFDIGLIGGASDPVGKPAAATAAIAAATAGWDWAKPEKKAGFVPKEPPGIDDWALAILGIPPKLTFVEVMLDELATCDKNGFDGTNRLFEALLVKTERPEARLLIPLGMFMEPGQLDADCKELLFEPVTGVIELSVGNWPIEESKRLWE